MQSPSDRNNEAEIDVLLVGITGLVRKEPASIAQVETLRCLQAARKYHAGGKAPPWAIATPGPVSMIHRTKPASVGEPSPSPSKFDSARTRAEEEDTRKMETNNEAAKIEKQENDIIRERVSTEEEKRAGEKRKAEEVQGIQEANLAARQQVHKQAAKIKEHEDKRFKAIKLAAQYYAHKQVAKAKKSELRRVRQRM